jgi:hypothetical protein
MLSLSLSLSLPLPPEKKLGDFCSSIRLAISVSLKAETTAMQENLYALL